jgi:tetratricopeptide (TPR) repeat protein
MVHRDAAPSALVAAVAVIALLSSFSLPAQADETATPDSSSVAVAERRAAEAFQAYARKEYATAVDLYLEAYAAAPSGSILYNIAHIYDLKLHHRAQAIAFYRRYIADPDAQPGLIETSNQRLRDLRNVDLTAAKPTDDASVPEDGAEQRARISSPRAAHDSSRERPGRWLTARWAGVALGAVGLAGVVGGTGFGLAAMSKADTAKGLCDGNDCTSQRGVDAANTARREALFSTIGFAGGGALLITGAALFFLGGERSSEKTGAHLEARTTPSQASLQVVAKW